MKKLLFVALVWIVSLNAVNAQELKLGFKFNPLIGFAAVTDDSGNEVPNRSNGARVGWMYGIVANYRITENYGIYTGVTIVNKGFTEEFARDTLFTSDQNIRVTTLEVPLTALLRSNEIANGIRFKGFFGFSLDLNVGYRNEFSGSNPFEPENGSGQVKGGNRLRNFGLSFIVGPGVDWETSIGTLGLGITFHQGLTNINKEKNTNFDGEIKPRYVSFDVDYFF